MFGLSTKATVIAVSVAVVVVAVTGWVAKEKLESYNKGKQAVIEKVNKETVKKQNAWKKIDDTNVTLDDALRGLQPRGNR